MCHTCCRAERTNSLDTQPSNFRHRASGEVPYQLAQQQYRTHRFLTFTTFGSSGCMDSARSQCNPQQHSCDNPSGQHHSYYISFCIQTYCPAHLHYLPCHILLLRLCQVQPQVQTIRNKAQHNNFPRAHVSRSPPVGSPSQPLVPHHAAQALSGPA
jgi:hypothetical protein